MYLKNKNLKLTLFLGLLATLPLAKGKVFELILLTNDQVTTNSLFNIDYAFQIYLSDVFLFFLIWTLVRNKKILSKIRKISLSKSHILFIVFILFSIFPGLFSNFPIVSLLSSFQLLKMFTLMIIPSLIEKEIKIKSIWEVIAAFISFQIILILLQKINGGPLGIYIESLLSKEEFGIRSNENPDILRLAGSFFEPSILGTFLLIQYSFLSKILSKAKIYKEKILLKITIIGIIIGILLTGSRGIYLIFFISLIPQIISFIKGKGAKNYKFDIKNIIFYLLPITLLLPYFLNRFSDFSKLFSKLGSGTYRLQMAEQSFLLAKNNILGVGLNLSPHSFAIQKFSKEIIFDPAHPHNIFFQILAETGFAGLFIFSLFVFFSIKEIGNFSKNPFFFSILIFLLSAQIYPIFINQPEIISFLFLYIGLSKLYIKT